MIRVTTRDRFTDAPRFDSVAACAASIGDFLAGAIGELPVWGLIEVHVANQHFADAEALVREIARDAESAPIDDELVPKPA